MGLQYRNRVASFVNKMSTKPQQIDIYRSNPMHRAGPPTEAKMSTFAADPRLTRTGFAFGEEERRLGYSHMRNSPVGRHVSIRKGILILFRLVAIFGGAYDRWLASWAWRGWSAYNIQRKRQIEGNLRQSLFPLFTEKSWNFRPNKSYEKITKAQVCQIWQKIKVNEIVISRLCDESL